MQEAFKRPNPFMMGSDARGKQSDSLGAKFNVKQVAGLPRSVQKLVSA